MIYDLEPILKELNFEAVFKAGSYDFGLRWAVVS